MLYPNGLLTLVLLQTALSYAVRQGQLAIVCRLVEAKCNPQAHDSRGERNRVCLSASCWRLSDVVRGYPCTLVRRNKR